MTTPSRRIAAAIAAITLAFSTTTALAQTPAKIDAADTAWMIAATALVLMMTIPGLALFYCGMVRKKNVLATMMQSFAICALISVVWMVAGYSLAFGEGGPWIGDLSRVLEDGTYTREELADTLETESRFVDELITVGVVGRTGELTQRDAEIARLALEMAKYSIQPRHLRGIMAAVEREAAMFKQILNPELRSGDEQRVQDAVNKARHLAAVDSRLKELMMANVIDGFSS